MLLNSIIDIITGILFSLQPLVVNIFPNIPLFYMIFANLLTIFLVNGTSLFITNWEKKKPIHFKSFLKQGIISLSIIHFLYFYLVFSSYKLVPISVSDPIYICGTLLLPEFYDSLIGVENKKMSYFNYFSIIGIIMLIMTQHIVTKNVRHRRIIGILSLLFGVTLYIFLFSTNVSKKKTQHIKNYKYADSIQQTNIFLIISSFVGTIICVIIAIVILLNKKCRFGIIGRLKIPNIYQFCFISLIFSIVSISAYMSLFNSLKKKKGADVRLVLSKTTQLITSCVLGYVILKERFSPLKIMAIIILLISIYYFHKHNLVKFEKIKK